MGHLGYKVRVWLASDPAGLPSVASLVAVSPSRKRPFQIAFEDALEKRGRTEWSALDRKKLRFSPLLGGSLDVAGSKPTFSLPERPFYIGSTDPGSTRRWMSRSLRRTLPFSTIDTYYMCVGGLSGFDGLTLLAQRGLEIRRVVLFDRDEAALAYGKLVLQLLGLCPNRLDFIQAIFGRRPEGQQGLSADNMFQFLQCPVDVDFIARVRQALPRRCRKLYDVVVQSAAYGADLDPDCPTLLPRRRLWPCWGLARHAPPLSGLHGGGNETFHFGETGWLASESKYRALRSLLAAGPEETGKKMQLCCRSHGPQQPAARCPA